MIEHIDGPSALTPRGHYSLAVKANGFIYLSGQLPLIPGSDLRIPEGLDNQVIQVFDNLKAVLGSAGCSLQDLVSVQVFITHMSNWPRINELYAQIFAEGPAPARTVISCPELHYGAEIEVSGVALARL